MNKSLVLFLFAMTVLFSYSQEICDNNIDDDNDGLIDFQDIEDCPCSLLSSGTLNVIPIYYIPNSFTPDGDERNNIFRPIFACGLEAGSYRLDVYDHKGQIIFTSMDVETGWDGTRNGTVLQQGTYMWKIGFTSNIKGETIVLAGYVNLIR